MKNIYNKIDALLSANIGQADCLIVWISFETEWARFTKPFGGIQMIFIGDLCQLPPVITGEEKNYFTHL
jgi:hypothetical protein